MIYDPEQPSYNSEALQIAGGDPDAYVIFDFRRTYENVGPALVRTGRWEAEQDVHHRCPGFQRSAEERGRRRNGGHAGHGTGLTRHRRRVGGVRQAVHGRARARAADVRRPQLRRRDPLLSGGGRGRQHGGAGYGEGVGRSSRAPGGDKYTWEQLPDAIKALEDGNDIDYEGASGPINLNEDGDPTAGVYDVFRYRDGKVEVFSEVPIEPPK